MAVVSKDDLMKRLSERIGEDNSDDALSLLEDFSDTFSEYESKESESKESENWKTKYEENDKEWRKRYKERFENIDESDVKVDNAKKAMEEVEIKTYEDLFSEVK